MTSGWLPTDDLALILAVQQVKIENVYDTIFILYLYVDQRFGVGLRRSFIFVLLHFE